MGAICSDMCGLEHEHQDDVIAVPRYPVGWRCRNLNPAHAGAGICHVTRAYVKTHTTREGIKHVTRMYQLRAAGNGETLHVREDELDVFRTPAAAAVARFAKGTCVRVKKFPKAIGVVTSVHTIDCRGELRFYNFEDPTQMAVLYEDVPEEELEEIEKPAAAAGGGGGIGARNQEILFPCPTCSTPTFWASKTARFCVQCNKKI